MTQTKDSAGNAPAANDPSPAKADGSSEAIGESRDNSGMLSEREVNNDASGVVLDERIQAQIGQQLSSFYRELVNQPIPQNFMDLLARLDRQDDGSEGDK